MFDFRVVAYVNGILFYPRCVSYSAQYGDMHTFTVDVPAVPQWDILPARSHCAIFFTDPITQTWRFLCEGEYEATGKTKTGEGSRNRSLIFRALHAYWGTAQYSSMLSLASGSGKGVNIAREVLLAKANGRELRFDSANAQQQIADLQVIIDNSTSKDDRISGFFPLLVKNVTLQTPVESFYFEARLLLDKMHAFADKEISALVDYRRFKDLIVNGFNNSGLAPNVTLAQLMNAYEDLAYYSHTPIPAPYIFQGENGSRKIMELMFIPHLYSVIPPACNVIFADQITTLSMSRSFLREPTRVITQLVAPPTEGLPIPIFYMANDLTKTTALTQKVNAKTPQLASTHELMSEEEMLKGVIASTANIGIEKLFPTHADRKPVKSTELIDVYMDEATRHQLEVERGRVRTTQIPCTFLPYLVPGFPCLVEDSTGPFFGIVDGVQHSMPCNGRPSTIVSVTHVREAYIRSGVNRTAPLPRWLNSIFYPGQVSETYKKILGLDGFGTMVGSDKILPELDEITRVRQQKIDDLISEIDATEGPADLGRIESIQAANSAPGQVDLDRLAQKLVAVPEYGEDFATMITDGSNLDYLAKQLRVGPDPARNFLQYQYRNGMNLSQYVEFHGLQIASKSDPDSNTAVLPEDLSPNGVHKLFGHPRGLTFNGVGGGESIYGVYSLSGGISDLRQKATRVIKESVERKISPT